MSRIPILMERFQQNHKSVQKKHGETGGIFWFFSFLFLLFDVSCSFCLIFDLWSFDLVGLLVGLLVLVLMVVVVGCCHRPWPHGGVDVLLLAGFNAAGREPNNQEIPAPLGTPKKALLLKIFPRWWFQIFINFIPNWGSHIDIFFKWVETTN